jgi:ABC-2 type transport system ATP-binding protein
VIIDHGRAVAAGSPAGVEQRIGGNIIDVHLRDRRDLATIAELLTHLGDSAAQIDEAERRVSVRVNSASDGPLRAMHSINATGIELEGIAIRQPNLDEVFLALTGQPKHDGPEQWPLAA